jgi:hypothetical protein
MLSQLTIPKKRQTEAAFDHEQLFAIGLAHAQRLSSRIWTDYNVHDPGITTLELLCFALTDLSYRASFPVRDLLATPKENAQNMAGQFFTARQILPNRPLTLLDYRKLLIDLAGVKNAWLFPADVTYFADLVEGKLEEKNSGKPGVIPVHLSGIYDVILEFMDDVKAGDKGGILKEAAERLQANRNLCEDFAGFTEIETEPYLICAELELTPEADPVEVKAQMLFQVQEYFAPSVNNYTLTEILGRKRADGTEYTSVEIFEGPALECGFIDDDELEEADLREKIYLSDVINILMDIEGVVAVRDIVVNPESAKAPLVDKWIVSVPSRKKPLLNRAKSRVVFYKRHMPVVANAVKVEARLGDLVENARAKAETKVLYDFEIPLGTFRDPGNYYSFQNHFPAIYGLSEIGVHSGPDHKEEILARQLKGYLLFFDQVMADYFAQLSHVKELFSTDANLPRTYFHQTANSFVDYEKVHRSEFVVGDFTDLAAFVAVLKDHIDPVPLLLWNRFGAATRGLINAFTGAPAQLDPMKVALSGELNGIINGVPIFSAPVFSGTALSTETQQLLGANPSGSILKRLNRLLLNDAFPHFFAKCDAEAPADFAERRNRFLDHLISRFAERFNDFVNIMYSAFGATPENLVSYRCEFLKNYPAISGERGLAYNDTLKAPADLWDSGNVSGLEKRLARLLGIPNFNRRNLADFAFDVNVEIDGAPDFGFRIREKVSGFIILSSHKAYASQAESKQALQRAIRFALLPGGYDRKTAIDGTFYFNIVDADKKILARRLDYFDTAKDREKAISDLMEYLRANYSDEGMYLVEHILLHPEQTGDPFLPICADPNCNDCAEADPYSYRISIILPAFSSRFSNMEFRRYAEQLIRAETPAHILPKICWISEEDMLLFEEKYRDWIYLKAGADITNRANKLNDFIEILFAVKNVYPSQALHECDCGEDMSKFILGQTSLGTMEKEKS